MSELKPLRLDTIMDLAAQALEPALTGKPSVAFDRLVWRDAKGGRPVLQQVIEKLAEDVEVGGDEVTAVVSWDPVELSTPLKDERAVEINLTMRINGDTMALSLAALLERGAFERSSNRLRDILRAAVK